MGKIVELACKQGNIKIDLTEDYCERLGGDGDWVRYNHGKVIESPFDKLEKGVEYIFLLEKYKWPYLVFDKKNNIVMNLDPLIEKE